MTALPALLPEAQEGAPGVGFWFCVSSRHPPPPTLHRDKALLCLLVSLLPFPTSVCEHLAIFCSPQSSDDCSGLSFLSLYPQLSFSKGSVCLLLLVVYPLPLLPSLL